MGEFLGKVLLSFNAEISLEKALFCSIYTNFFSADLISVKVKGPVNPDLNLKILAIIPAVLLKLGNLSRSKLKSLSVIKLTLGF